MCIPASRSQSLSCLNLNCAPTHMRPSLGNIPSTTYFYIDRCPIFILPIFISPLPPPCSCSCPLPITAPFLPYPPETTPPMPHFNPPADPEDTICTSHRPCKSSGTQYLPP